MQFVVLPSILSHCIDEVVHLVDQEYKETAPNEGIHTKVVSYEKRVPLELVLVVPNKVQH